MNFLLTQTIIKQLCGDVSYKKGVAYFRAKKVTFKSFDPHSYIYEATVNITSIFRVTIENDLNGPIIAKCTCPSLGSFDKYCQHIAAVLLYIHSEQQLGNTPSTSPAVSNQLQDGNFKENRGSDFNLPKAIPTEFPTNDIQLTNRMLGLFTSKPVRPISDQLFSDSREQLAMEITCRSISLPNGKYGLGIEAKVGRKRLYVVHKLKDFLEKIAQRETCELTKDFTYNPELHSFQKEIDPVIRELIKIHQNEKIFLETSNSYAHLDDRVSERMILIPPSSWEILLPFLTVAPLVKLEYNGISHDGISLSNDPIPLQFEFAEATSEGYQLDVQGLDQITVMEAYGFVLSEGKLLKFPVNECKRLAELKYMLDSSGKHKLQIQPGQMENFVEKVIPSLMKFGNVRIAKAVSDRLVRTPLKAKLFLDRVKNRLLAGLELHYGNIVINPLEINQQEREAGPILVRDGDQEREILQLMEDSSFGMTEGGYFMHNEDLEYNFLYHVVPKLKKMVTIYATTAVKERLHTGNTRPKIRVDVDERTDWLKFEFDMLGIPESEIRNVLLSLEEKRKYYKLSSGTLLPLENSEFQEINLFLNGVDINIGNLNGKDILLPVVKGIPLIDSLQQGNAVIIGKSFRKLLENIRNPDHLEFAIPDSLNPVLREYQKYGFQWMKTLAHYRFGGILADDMGLGKTLQSIAFIVSVLQEIRTQKLPAMIVCPSSLVYNWLNELKKFAPEVRAVIVDGNKSDRSRILKNVTHLDVIITSYPLLRRDIKMYVEQPFHTIILDEAQAFKNHGTQTAKAVKMIQSDYRFALTGTPVENSIDELWSIFNVVFPNLLPGRTAFKDLSRGTVAKRIRPFLLRRLKDDVLKELPEKIETIQSSEMLTDQKKLYAAYLAKLKHDTLKHLNKDSFQKNRIKILAGITRLRQLCCHPALFVDGYKGTSAKFEQLLEIVNECRTTGKRMLIFSQFTKMLEIIGRELGYQGMNYFYLDGKTPASERVELCNRFNEGEGDLFLISLKAGGTGLNLTGADTVILYDLWWNPAVEQQAADRAHRMGQMNVVQVIKLVARGTIEDRMHDLQERKKNLIEEITEPGQEKLSALTEQDIKEILMI